jgi:hypothetical protein
MLSAEAHRLAKQRAGELGVSLAEYIRQALDRELGEPAPPGDISAIFGIFNTGEADVSQGIYRYVDQAVSGYHASRGR